MGEAAVAAARAAGYRNAGTIEFLVEGDGDAASFYFLEMNTRLQVEHPVTEEVTGVDLVRAQFTVAAGGALPWRQEALSQRGHAIECRIYAEDPEHGFLPQAGPLLLYREPSGPGVRIDSGVTEGDDIGVHYDPLLAKLIVSAETRDAACARALEALRAYPVLGTRTNIPFLIRLLELRAFREGHLHTGLIDEHFQELTLPIDAPPVPIEALVAAAFAAPRDAGAHGPLATPGDVADPWSTLGDWGRYPMTTPHHADARRRRSAVQVEWFDDGPRFERESMSRTLSSSVTAPVSCASTSERNGDGVDRRRRRRAMGVRRRRGVRAHRGASAANAARRCSHHGSLTAPMPATVLRVLVKAGDTVRRGDSLVILEAMKMELPVRATTAGTVRAVHCREGELVQPGVTLVEIDELDETATKHDLPPRHDRRSGAARWPAERVRDGVDRQTRWRSSICCRPPACRSSKSSAFVSPKWVPQMADAGEVFAGITRRPGVRYTALVPNLAGLERAHAAGVSEIAIFAAASETFSLKNINQSIDASLDELPRRVRTARRRSACASAPTSRPRSGVRSKVTSRPSAWPRCAGALIEMGAFEVSVSDTIGIAHPGQVPVVVGAVTSRVPLEKIALHFHDTRGTALANVLTALQTGRGDVRRVGRRSGRLPVRARSDRQPRDRRSDLHARWSRNRDRREPGRARRRVSVHRVADWTPPALALLSRGRARLVRGCRSTSSRAVRASASGSARLFEHAIAADLARTLFVRAPAVAAQTDDRHVARRLRSRASAGSARSRRCRAA